MPRKFNTAGPIIPSRHYYIDPFKRIDWEVIEELIDDAKYFTLHAPRQSGKTTLLNAIVDKINEDGVYEAMYINVEASQTARHDFEKADRMIAGTLLARAKTHLPHSWLVREGAATVREAPEGILLTSLLSQWAHHSPKPTVLLVDEIDSLIGDTLVSVLRQLRAGYNDRPRDYPQSVILCGVRYLRDYRIHQSNGEPLTGGSCFNISAEALRLGSFSETEIRELYQQHTNETGQRFEEPIFELLQPLTGGQPWLVNALAHEVTHRMEHLRDRARTITADDILEAKERLILRREVHLDQLADKLKEDRVRRVIEPMLAGEQASREACVEDWQYVADLGLVDLEGPRKWQISNAIYREVIPRSLTFVLQGLVERKVPVGTYHLADGRLNFRAMLAGFQQFYGESAGFFAEDVVYKQAAPQLTLQAWLQGLVNSGGLIAREYSLGSGRVDLFVRYFPQVGGKREEQRFVVEIKVVGEKSSVETTIREGLEQTARYAENCGSEDAHLVVVNPRKGLTWEQRVYVREEQFGDRGITVWGM